MRLRHGWNICDAFCLLWVATHHTSREFFISLAFVVLFGIFVLTLVWHANEWGLQASVIISLFHCHAYTTVSC
jgi:hypothetical protein